MSYLQTQVTTQIIIKNKKGEILLLRRSKPGGWFTLPGGTVKIGEAVAQAAEREIFEETGLKLKVNAPVRIWQSDHIGKPLLGIVFDTKTKVADKAKIKIAKEHNAWQWFSYQKLMQDKAVDPYIKGVYLKFK